MKSVRRLLGRRDDAEDPAPFLHVVLTRYNIGAFNERWLEYRQKLFETITLPSIDAQSEKNFIWVLAIDSRTSERYRKRLDELMATRPHIRLLEVELFHDHIPAMVQWCRDAAAAAGVTHMLTSRLDNDDALHSDLFARIQHHARKVLEENRELPALIAPSMGYQWVPASGSGFPAFHDSPSTGTSLLESVDKFESVFMVPHHLLPNAISSLYGTVKAIDGDTRWWMHAATDASLSVLQLNSFRREKTIGQKTARKMDAEILKTFGVTDGEFLRSLPEPAFVENHEEIIQHGKQIDERIKVVRTKIKQRAEAGEPEDPELTAKYEALHRERRENAASLME
jgi:hypothetical protein